MRLSRHWEGKDQPVTHSLLLPPPRRLLKYCSSYPVETVTVQEMLLSERQGLTGTLGHHRIVE